MSIKKWADMDTFKTECGVWILYPKSLPRKKKFSHKIIFFAICAKFCFILNDILDVLFNMTHYYIWVMAISAFDTKYKIIF